ncbi:hypothetical protein BaRGS_00004639 [Batillaria attramentaria]|uniref:Uncharacterized protein n=1 Tax=Batillaria attramentaria TaxID=370345 RepID=A0ABD0LXG4_9CAEN
MGESILRQLEYRETLKNSRFKRPSRQRPDGIRRGALISACCQDNPPPSPRSVPLLYSAPSARPPRVPSESTQTLFVGRHLLTVCKMDLDQSRPPVTHILDSGFPPQLTP